MGKREVSRMRTVVFSPGGQNRSCPSGVTSQLKLRTSSLNLGVRSLATNAGASISANSLSIGLRHRIRTEAAVRTFYRSNGTPAGDTSPQEKNQRIGRHPTHMF